MPRFQTVPTFAIAVTTHDAVVPNICSLGMRESTTKMQRLKAGQKAPI